MQALTNVLTFLISTVFTLYLAAVVMRIILGLRHSDFYNPLAQFVLTITNPLVLPLRKLLPSIGMIDTASFALALFLKLIEMRLIHSLTGIHLSLGRFLFVAITELIALTIYIYIAAIIVLAISSWITPSGGAHANPVLLLLRSITEPLIRPLRKIIPPIGMVDLSPLAALVLLNILLIIIRSL